MSRKVLNLVFALIVVIAIFSASAEATCVARANSLVGKSRAEYVCNQVVNYALTGVANNGMLARSYLTWGRKVNSPGTCVVVVGNDGVHVGIFVNSSEFIHSSSSRFQVIKVGSSQLKYVFPSGYQFRSGGFMNGENGCSEEMLSTFPENVRDAVKNLLPVN